VTGKAAGSLATPGLKSTSKTYPGAPFKAASTKPQPNKAEAEMASPGQPPQSHRPAAALPGASPASMPPQSLPTPGGRAIEPGQAFGDWQVIGADPTGRRVVVGCVCRTVRQIAIDVLLAGESRGCGCRPTSRPTTHPPTDPTFARVNWGKVR
jgi:hypothetical protein